MRNSSSISKSAVTFIAHVAAWICFFSLPYLVFSSRLREFTMSNHQLANIICINIFLIIFYYINTLVLIPKMMVKEKWLLYSLSIVACMAVFLFIPKAIATVIAPPEYILLKNEVIRNPAFTGKPRFSKPPPRWLFRTRGIDMNDIFIFGLVFTVGTSISITQRWLKTEQNRKETENEKLNTELSFLKSQVNPHFFFNTLNNIYSLAIVRSEKTAPAVMKLSSIMRYILTETERNLVPLNNEVDFIHNFIELQQVRLTDKVHINFDVTGNVDTILIAPLLFIPFVENAFKYGVSTKSASTIDIHLKAEDNKIFFSVVNFIIPSENNLMENTGIGINNVKRRLELMYEGKHHLTTLEKDNYYTVHLEITT